MSYKVWADQEVLTAADVNNYLMRQAVPRFDSVEARYAVLPDPDDGMISWVTGLGLQVFVAGQWTAAPGIDTMPGFTVDGDLIVEGDLTIDGAITGIDKADVGLSNVDNISDAAKPVSTATQTALDAKAPLASPAFTGTPTGLTKAHVGLGNVDNTADTAKPVSTAQAAADALKLDLTGGTLTGALNMATGAANGIIFATDTNLYRSAADTLKTDDNLLIGGYAIVTGNLVAADVYIGAAQDSHIYRSGVAALRTNSSFQVDGNLYFGTAADTNLYRGAANFLKTDDSFGVALNLYVQHNGADQSGFGNVGPGGQSGITLGADVNLYRSSANVIKTDDTLGSAVDIYAQYGNSWSTGIGSMGPASEPGIKIGADCNLYRSAANWLSTDDSLKVGGETRLSGNVGFFNATPAAKPAVTGSRGGNAALASLITALAGLGLITDSTTA